MSKQSNEKDINSRSVTGYYWSPKKKRAARLVAQGNLTRDEICAQVPCGPESLWRWKKQPRFMAKVHKLQEAIGVNEASSVLALRVRRMSRLNRRAEKMDRVIEARAADPKMQGVPGGDTGLLTVDQKTVAGVATPIYSVDTALLRELRETEKQAAIEAGQWLEKREVSGAMPQITVVEIVRPVMPGDAPVDQVIEQRSQASISRMPQDDDGWDEAEIVPSVEPEAVVSEPVPQVLYDPDD
jgi:hypothetical protein